MPIKIVLGRMSQCFRLPCIGGSPQPQPLPQIATTPAQSQTTSESAFVISAMLRRIEFLTADGFPPYTGRSLEGGGMLTQVISSSMGLIKEEAKGRFDYGISWVNDWAAHLNPLLLTRAGRNQFNPLRTSNPVQC